MQSHVADDLELSEVVDPVVALRKVAARGMAACPDAVPADADVRPEPECDVTLGFAGHRQRVSEAPGVGGEDQATRMIDDVDADGQIVDGLVRPEDDSRGRHFAGEQRGSQSGLALHLQSQQLDLAAAEVHRLPLHRLVNAHRSGVCARWATVRGRARGIAPAEHRPAPGPVVELARPGIELEVEFIQLPQPRARVHRQVGERDPAAAGVHLRDLAQRREAEGAADDIRGLVHSLGQSDELEALERRLGELQASVRRQLVDAVPRQRRKVVDHHVGDRAQDLGILGGDVCLDAQRADALVDVVSGRNDVVAREHEVRQDAVERIAQDGQRPEVRQVGLRVVEEVPRYALVAIEFGPGLRDRSGDDRRAAPLPQRRYEQRMQRRPAGLGKVVEQYAGQVAHPRILEAGSAQVVHGILQR